MALHKGCTEIYIYIVYYSICFPYVPFFHKNFRETCFVKSDGLLAKHSKIEGIPAGKERRSELPRKSKSKDLYRSRI